MTRSDKALADLARMVNPSIGGWINDYSHFYKPALYRTLRRIDAFLIRWARRKFKRLRRRPRGARKRFVGPPPTVRNRENWKTRLAASLRRFAACSAIGCRRQ